MSRPRFDELPVRPGAPARSSWGVFGDDDQVGTLNFIEPRHARAAAALVRDGDVHPLNWDLTLPAPGFFGRHPPSHTLFSKFDGNVVDDRLDGFYPQGSSQWDGLRHFAAAGHGFYNGATLEEVTTPGPGPLGMEHWARRGIAARAVLLDVAGALAREGAAPDPFDRFVIDAPLLERVAAAQGVELREGDVLLVRTGWVEAYAALGDDARAALAAAGRPGSPGLYGDTIPRFLWDHGIAAVAADNPALEAAAPGDGADLSLHEALIGRLGMPLGELWALAGLAQACAADGRYEMFLTSAPMHLPGASGTPANAIAVR
ncbi:cyclase family protein [Baekduia soli]|uniref:cyclase family protein n=1 Tax=Baekduia soli TaxID=496014 RepID=UPI001651D8ED|nr:cyclase family protein [Baekduia soli]